MDIFTDDSGNRLMINGSRIELSLKEETRIRHIGTIIPEKKAIYMERKGRHVVIKNNSYGFCHKVLELAVSSDKIILKDPDGKYVLPIKVILNEGSFLWFKKRGFERQIFLPIDRIKDFKVE